MPSVDPPAVVRLAHGTTLGRTRLVDEAVELDFRPVWGIDADGQPYFDPAGVPDADAAVLTVDGDGNLAVVKPGEVAEQVPLTIADITDLAAALAGKAAAAEVQDAHSAINDVRNKLPRWRPLFQGAAAFSASGSLLLSEASAGAEASGGLRAFYFDPAEHPPASKVRLTALITPNTVAPAADVTTTLRRVSGLSGTGSTVGAPTSALSPVIDAAATAAQLAAAVTANEPLRVVSADFDPPAAGRLAVRVSVSATPAASFTVRATFWIKTP